MPLPADAAVMPPLTDALVVLVALAVAATLRPWRVLGGAAPPWPWGAVWVLLPLLWGLDRYTGSPSLLAMSGAPLLVLAAGWPFAVLAMLPAALIVWMAGPMPALEALHRLAWWGVVPATLALGIGVALRHFAPSHVFVYILGRGFLGTIVAVAAARVIDQGLHGPSGVSAPADQIVAGVLAAFGEGFLTGMLVAIVVAFRPQWLATYTDRLYLPPPAR